MACNLGSLDLTNAEKASTWLLAFSALARAKQWKDVPAVSADPKNSVAATAPNLVIMDNFSKLWIGKIRKAPIHSGASANRQFII